jgi:hypothetical protein
MLEIYFAQTYGTICVILSAWKGLSRVVQLITDGPIPFLLLSLIAHFLASSYPISTWEKKAKSEFQNFIILYGFQLVIFFSGSGDRTQGLMHESKLSTKLDYQSATSHFLNLAYILVWNISLKWTKPLLFVSTLWCECVQLPKVSCSHLFLTCGLMPRWYLVTGFLVYINFLLFL